MGAQYGQIVLRTPAGGKLNIQAYFDDTAGHQVNVDSGAGASATSENFYVAPFPIIVVDVILAAATTQTQTRYIKNGIVLGTFINSTQLAAVVNRPGISVGLNKGDKFAMVQVA